MLDMNTATKAQMKTLSLAKQTEAFTHPKGSTERNVLMAESKECRARCEAGCCDNR
jgi:hypothetical protein